MYVYSYMHAERMEGQIPTVCFEMGLLCYPDWSQAPGLQQFAYLTLPDSSVYRYTVPCPQPPAVTIEN